MSGTKRFLRLAGLALVVSGWAQAALPDKVEKALQAQGTDAGSLAVLVMPLDGGPARLAQGADRSMNPASTMKLLTTLASLEQLGPNYRWKTALLSEDLPQDGVLRGPLYLRGGGDPALSWDKLAQMLRALRAKGVARIEGDLVLDRSYFQPQRPDLGLPPFDETPAAYYNVVPDALLVHSNLLELTLSSSKDQVRIQTQPPMDGVAVESALQLTEQPCQDWEDDWPLPLTRKDADGTVHITLQGNFPRDCQASTDLNVLDRNVYIERLVRALWREMGGTWQGSARDGIAPITAQVLVERRSDALADLVRTANKRSDNAMVRTFYLTLAAERAARTGNRDMDMVAGGQAAVQEWLDRHHIAREGLVLENGSGLSRLERISPRQLAAVLKVGALSDWSAEYMASLPIAAVDGTMRRRLHGTVAAGRAHLKTGTLNDAVAIAGYVRDIADKNWVVVCIINTPKAEPGRPALDALVEWVASGAPVPGKANARQRSKRSR